MSAPEKSELSNEWIEVVDDPGPDMPIRDLVEAVYNVPIFTRLHIARNLIIANGGDNASQDFVPGLLASVEIIDTVLDELFDHPRAAKLGGPMYRKSPTRPKPEP